MNFNKWADAKVKKLDWKDIALVKFSCITFGLILATLDPCFTKVNILWYIGIFILFSIIPFSKAFKK